MYKDYSKVDEGLDFFEFFERLWRGRRRIGTSALIAALLGGGLIYFEDPVFESKIFYDVDTLPAFYGKDEVIDDFQKNFYSVSVFDDWKKSNSSGPLVYENFKKTAVIDGFVLSKNEATLLATFETNKKGITSIIIKTDQLATLDDFFKYAKHVNDELEAEYVSRAKDELTFLDSRSKISAPTNRGSVEMAVLHNRFITSLENGMSVLTIKNPTMPEKLSPQSLLNFMTWVASGVMIGILLVFFLDAVKARKVQLVEKKKVQLVEKK